MPKDNFLEKHSFFKIFSVISSVIKFIYGYSYYNGELILQPQQGRTQQQQLELLDTHPLFTGKCPQCNYEFDRDWSARVHWDCPECGWMDDTV
ncbi:MAG: hypothetical protein V7K18_19930 [Nostoc sp.]|uniref:hypothetical protein n=1 Tax=Nostoc sp. TaxID=1180 RepID=UPI002FFCF4A8